MIYKHLDLWGSYQRIDNVEYIEQFFFRHIEPETYTNWISEFGPFHFIEWDFNLYMFQFRENNQPLVIHWLNGVMTESELISILGLNPEVDKLLDIAQACSGQ